MEKPARGAPASLREGHRSKQADRFRQPFDVLNRGKAMSRPRALSLISLLSLLVACGEAPPESTDGLPPTSLVIHDAPVRKGDSGGPLTTLDGRLVALNVIYAPLTGRHQSVRPDPSWVDWVIGVDRLRRRRAHAHVATLPRAQ